MGRAQQASPFAAAPTSTTASYDPYLDLGRLLGRLEQNILRSDSEKWRRLVADEFQRLQARFDVAAARSLLARIEQDAAATGSKAALLARRQEWHEWQSELARRRQLVDRLQQRLDDLDAEARLLDDGNDEDEDERESGSVENGQSERDASLSSATTDGAVRGIPTPSESLDARSTDGNAGGRAEAQTPVATATATATTTRAPACTPASAQTWPAQATATATPRPAGGSRRPAATQKTRRARPADGAGSRSSSVAGAQAVRRRGPASSAPSAAGKSLDVSTTTSAHVEGRESTTALRHSLLSAHDTAGSGIAAVATEEVLLDHHRREQEALSEDILRLAQALKKQSLATSRLLEDDKDVVDRVGEGLHTTNERLTAASRSMALLSRMTEGKGWWGRLLLYGMVYGLMVVLVLLFAFLPKLRL